MKHWADLLSIPSPRGSARKGAHDRIRTRGTVFLRVILSLIMFLMITAWYFTPEPSIYDVEALFDLEMELDLEDPLELETKGVAQYYNELAALDELDIEQGLEQGLDPYPDLNLDKIKSQELENDDDEGGSVDIDINGVNGDDQDDTLIQSGDGKQTTVQSEVEDIISTSDAGKVKESSSTRVEEFVPLYDEVYAKYQKERKSPYRKKQEEEVQLEENEAKAKQQPKIIRSMDTYGKDILQNPKACEITVVIMDPRIPNLQKGSPDFFALESVGAYLPNACVIIQTSKCKFQMPNQNQEQYNENPNPPSDKIVDQAVYQRIYALSLPLFQDMMERGRVRVKFLNHQTYHLRSCHDFFNPSAAVMNVNYWGKDEFIPDVDSDTVLIFQGDAMLCHSFDVDYWRKFALVGGVWHNYACGMLKDHWKLYMKPQASYKHKEMNNLLTDEDKKLEYELDAEFPSICRNKQGKKNGLGPLGNGGFSLRSRKAMIKAIQTCPHTTWSGIDVKDRSLPCLVQVKNDRDIHAMQEDVYFGTVLRATGAVMPTAYEATLFSTEMNWPGQALAQYGGPEEEAELIRIAREASCEYHGASTVQWADSQILRRDTVSIGFHQPFVYHVKETFLTGDVVDQCPFVKYMYDPLHKKNMKAKKVVTTPARTGRVRSIPRTPMDSKRTTGLIILGMHRSGTSMLAGLLSKGFGYSTGGPLFGPNEQNPNGFFELISASEQNEEILNHQNMNWHSVSNLFDVKRPLPSIASGDINFARGDSALKFLNSSRSAPWIQKDPRMCFTIGAWLPFLYSKPAVLFSYRHPLEVALSLLNIHNDITSLTHGLRLWIVYNRNAIQNSMDLCRVHTSHKVILSDASNELKRITNDLTKTCGVPAAPKEITQNVIDDFIDPSLDHHSNKSMAGISSRPHFDSLDHKGITNSAQLNYISLLEEGCEIIDSEARGKLSEAERKIYVKAIKLYCDFESGEAYKIDYIWENV